MSPPTPEQLFQQALHDHATRLATAPDPTALGGRLRRRDRLVALQRGAIIGGLAVVLAAGGVFANAKRQAELQTAGSPELTTTTGAPTVTRPGDVRIVLGGDTLPVLPDQGTIVAGDDAGTTVPGGSTPSTSPPTSANTTTTTITRTPTGGPVTTIAGDILGPDPGPSTTVPNSDHPATTVPGATTTSARPTAAPTTIAPTTAPPTTATTTTTTTTTAPGCVSSLVPTSGSGDHITVKMTGKAPTGTTLIVIRNPYITSGPLSERPSPDGTWTKIFVLDLIPVGTSTEIYVTCETGMQSSSQTFTRIS